MCKLLYKNIYLQLFTLAFISFFYNHHVFPQEKKIAGSILIKNITIVDVNEGKLIQNQNILIVGNEIESISNSPVNLTADTAVDCRGKFIIPGLWDMHTHNWWQLHFSNYYIGNGVLGVRNMYTPMSMIKPVKDSIKSGQVLGPYYVSAGRVLEGTGPEFPDWLVVDRPEKIKPALDTLQMEGSDFVKVYNKIPRDVYFELVKEAHKRGMKVEGHVPMTVSVIEASNAGQKSFEHLLGIPELSTQDPINNNKYGSNWFAAVMNSDAYGKFLIDENLALKNFEVLRNNNSYVCPTLVVWYNYFHPDTLFEKNSTLQKFPGQIIDFWSREISKYRSRENIYKQLLGKKYKNFQRLTYLLYKSGVPLLAGTDAINPYVYPGFSLHRELTLLKECGIPDKEILKMTTINAARFLELSDKYGSVEIGKKASIVILNDDPLKDIANTQKIDSIILDGRLISNYEINQLLK